MLPYRIHDLPDPEKLENLSQFIARFGYKVRTSGTKTDISKSINHLLDDIHGKKEENLIETVSIRAMQKARYSTHNIGHYGLAFEYYTHFTSPIRRFPDMMVHRLVTKYMDGGRSVSKLSTKTSATTARTWNKLQPMPSVLPSNINRWNL